MYSYQEAAETSGVPEGTVEWYVRWAQKFAVSMQGKPLPAWSAEEAQRFLDKLPREKAIEPWQVKQARDALVFLYRDFLNLDVEIESKNAHERSDQTTAEAASHTGFRDQVTDKPKLEALHRPLFEQYGSGLRLIECVRLRVKDVDFEAHRITVRDGKGKKDRLTLLPKAFVQRLQEQLAYVRAPSPGSNQPLAARCLVVRSLFVGVGPGYSVDMQRLSCQK